MKNKKNIAVVAAIAVTVFATFAFFESVSGMLNPATVYCESLGYEHTIKSTPEGDYGICHLPDGSAVGEWKFISGKEGQEHSYCYQKGYEMKTVSEGCQFSAECAVCVLENGEEVEVTELMELNFNEGACGDGKCVLGENYETCPEDCPSGFFDLYCDGVSDDLCDPDCTSETDPDCTEKLVNDIDVAICADKDCFQKSKSFAQGETVYFKINNHINLDISSTVKTPSGEIENLIFKENLAIFQSDEIGEFSLWVNLLEGEYKKIKIEKEFSYIEKSAEIPPASICNVNGKCEGNENEQNCPQDCSSKEESKLFIYAFVIIALMIMGIAGFVIYKKRKKAKADTQ